jgi:hypothetical protein
MSAIALVAQRGRIDPRAMLWLTAAATVFSAQLIFGYPVVDKIAVSALLGLMLLGIWPRDCEVGSTARQTTLFKVHRMAFIAFALYGLVEALRGAIVLADPRVGFYAAMFALIALLAWLTTGESMEPDRAARVIALSSALYFLVYIAAGVVAEWIFGGNRVDLQGSVWSGTTVAVFPAYLAFPALAALRKDRPRDRWSFWVTLMLIVFVAFYYQSRTLWISMFVLAPLCMGLRRLAIFAAILAAFFVFFPWNDPRPLTPARFWDDFTQNVSMLQRPADLAREKAERAGDAVVGDAAAVVKESTRTPEPSPAPGESPATPVHDVDRVIAIQAAWCTATYDGAGRVLFGSGYWTSRYEMVPCIQRIAAAHNYRFPPVYDTIVRTATFNGMLVDMGVVGVLMLILLFGLTAVAIVASRTGPVLASLASLALMGLSLFTSQNYGLLLLYFAVMPAGPLLLLHGAQATARQRT